MIDELEELIRFSRGQPDGTRIWPCLVGPTGVGKTARARVLAERLGLPLHVVLLGSMLVEDVGGVPRADSRQLVWALPQWATEPGLILLDELDKCSPDHWGAVLTMLTSHTVRGIRLPAESCIIAAMQPVEPTEFLADSNGTALAARLCWVPVHGTDAMIYVAEKHQRPVPDWCKETTVACPVLPSPTPRQSDWLAALWDSNCRNSTRELALAGTVHQSWQTAVREWLCQQTPVVEATSVVAALNHDPALVQKLSPLECATLFPITAITPNMNLLVVEELLVRALTNCTMDECTSMLQSLYDQITSQQETNGTFGAWEPHSERAVHDMFVRATHRAYDILSTRFDD